MGRPTDKKRTEFGERLYAARMQEGLTQQAIAESLGITAQGYAKWERTPIALKPEQIDQVADILGVSLDYLFGREPLPASSPRKSKGKK